MSIKEMAFGGWRGGLGFYPANQSNLKSLKKLCNWLEKSHLVFGHGKQAKD